MVGGLVTSAFLTLEIIPVVYTYWRQEQVLWERLGDLGSGRLALLRRWTRVQQAGWGIAVALLAAAFFLRVPLSSWWGALALPFGLVVLGSAAYLKERPAARAQVWPAQAASGGARQSAA
jgi:Cu(I)/Ag(I) efflux system membrane protein CusA/SilA